MSIQSITERKAGLFKCTFSDSGTTFRSHTDGIIPTLASLITELGSGNVVANITEPEAAVVTLPLTHGDVYMFDSEVGGVVPVNLADTIAAALTAAGVGVGVDPFEAVNTTYDQTFGTDILPPIDLSGTGQIVAFDVNLDAYDSHWGCLISGTNFRVSHEGTQDGGGDLNFEYKDVGGWFVIKYFTSLPSLALGTTYAIAFRVDEAGEMAYLSVDGVEESAPMNQNNPEDCILEAVGRNDTTSGTINYLMGTISNFTVTEA